MARRQPLAVHMGYGEAGGAGGVAAINEFTAGLRASKNAYEAGPEFEPGQDGRVRVAFECDAKNGAAFAFIKLQTKLGGNDGWFDHCAADELILVGSELQNEAYAYVVKIPLADNQFLGFSFEEVDTQYCRLSIKTDVAGADIRCRVGV